MRITQGWTALMLSLVAVAGCDSRDADLAPDVPYYFLAVHNEPYNGQGPEQVRKDYEVLKQMVDRADQYGFKLTLMFTPQWVAEVAADAAARATLQGWKDAGHEIAAHHHSIYHGNWDGYSNYSRAEAEAQRHKQGKNKAEPYYGTLDAYMTKLRQINPKMKAGCVNDESDKKAMPDGIVYDTCSGFANFGPVGQRANDTEAGKGRNDYVSVGASNGITRKWLTHFQVTTDTRQKEGQAAFAAMGGAQVYGAVTHSIERQAQPFYDFLAFLSQQDPGANRTRTVSEILDGALLPEKTLSQELVSKKYVGEDKPPKGKCGDGVCDAMEKKNPKLCPGDCGGE